jgi:polyhydroxyalkanoate synthase
MEPYTPIEFQAQVTREMERAMLRFQKGLEFLTAPQPARVGLTPRDLIHASDTRQLWRYRRDSPAMVGRPLLIVHSLITRPYIFDLYPGCSLVEYMLGQGHDVFLLDWGAPRDMDRHLRLEDYVCQFLPRAVEQVRRASGASEVSLFGYCLGGTIILMYVAVQRPHHVRNLVALAAPVTFSKLGLFNLWADRRFFDVDLLVDTLGQIPPEMMLAAFKGLRPTSDYVKYYGLFKNIGNEQYEAVFRAFDRWTADHVPMAGETARQVIKELLQEDRLVRRELALRGKTVDLGDVGCAFLNCVGSKDFVVPLDANRPVMELVGSADKQEIVLDAGHMGIVAGRDASRKLWPRMDEWLRRRSR